MGETWRQQHHRATREEILAVARGLMLEEGIEGLSVRELARRTGFGPASLYTYFAGKAEIVTAITGESVRELDEYLDRVPDDLPSDERIVKLCLAYLAFADENPADFACLIEVGLRGGEATAVVAESMEAARQRFAETIRDGRMAGANRGTKAGASRGAKAGAKGASTVGGVSIRPVDDVTTPTVDDIAAGLLAQVHGVAVLRHAGVAGLAEDAVEAIVRRAADSFVAR